MPEGNLTDFNLNEPIELNQSMPADKLVFYNMAKKMIEYQTRKQNRDWNEKYLGKQTETIATYVVQADKVFVDDVSLEKWVNTLKIFINKGIIDEIGEKSSENFDDIIPFIIEHEIFEAWLSAKRGIGQKLKLADKHKLAVRRQFYLAMKNGLAEKLLRFCLLINPTLKQQCDEAIEYASNRIENENA